MKTKWVLQLLAWLDIQISTVSDDLVFVFHITQFSLPAFCLSALSFHESGQAKIPNLLFSWAQKNLHRPDIKAHLGKLVNKKVLSNSGLLRIW
jgi:hypothetical protein